MDALTTGVRISAIAKRLRISLESQFRHFLFLPITRIKCDSFHGFFFKKGKKTRESGDPGKRMGRAYPLIVRLTDQRIFVLSRAVFNRVSQKQDQSNHAGQSQRTDNSVNQSKRETNTCRQREARENVCNESRLV